MIKSKHLNLLYYLILCTFGYIFGLYITYSKILDDNSPLNSTNDGLTSSDKCYTFKKVSVNCVE